MTESIGGIWQGLGQNEPTYIPLDEFISNKLLEDLNKDRNAASTELVLEHEGR